MSKTIALLLLSVTLMSVKASRELCPCVSSDSCSNDQVQYHEDKKYFETVLKCAEAGFVRCCIESEIIKRSDDIENVIFIDEVEATTKSIEDTTDIEVTERVTEIPLENILDTTEVSTESSEAFNSISQVFDFLENFEDISTNFPETTDESLINSPDTTQPFDDILTTTDNPEITTTSNDLELPEIERNGKFIDDHVSVIYPNLNDPDGDRQRKLAEMRQHLQLIFPNGEIEAALKTINPSLDDSEVTTTKKPRRVVVRKRLLRKKLVDGSFEGAESMITKAVVEPQTNIERIKKRLSDRLKNQNETTTKIPLEETTAKSKRRKKIKYRSTTKSIPSSTLGVQRAMKTKEESTTTAIPPRPIRKQIYDVSSRSNFLKKATTSEPENAPEIETVANESSEKLESTVDVTLPTEPFTEEVQIISSTEVPKIPERTRFTSRNQPPKTRRKSTTQSPPTKLPKVVAMSPIIDSEHEAMIETVRKTLKAVQSGADVNYIRTVMSEYEKKVQEIRRNPPTRATTTVPTKPYRGSMRYLMTERRPPQEPNTRAPNNRNILRSRGLTSTQIPKTTLPPKMIEFDYLDLPPTLNSPADFRPSPLYGVTMDKSNEFDMEDIEKVHDTFTPPPQVQNGFFPVIENGTPSTIL